MQSASRADVIIVRYGVATGLRLIDTAHTRSHLGCGADGTSIDLATLMCVCVCMCVSVRVRVRVCVPVCAAPPHGRTHTDADKLCVRGVAIM